MLKSFTRRKYPINFVYSQQRNTDLFNFIIQNYYDELKSFVFGAYSKEERYGNLKKFNISMLQKINQIKENITENDDYIKTCNENNISLIFGLYLKNVENLKQDIFDIQDEILTFITRKELIENKNRIDGRKINQVRPILCKTDILPVTHGSSLFQRGETQVLNILTLGSSGNHMQTDNVDDFTKNFERYIHHYNFPPYSVGETGRIGFVNRREIGHGNLAQKALSYVIPNDDNFMYTIRLVSECLGSNGSTSMASTCASTLTLMDGGIQIKDMISGVAMGLALDDETKQFTVLTDIQGWEDRHADMDFKVTGNKCAITAIQLDNKVGGLSLDILKQALDQAEEGRIYILEKMQETINRPRLEPKENTPQIKFLIVPVDKMRDVIGSGGVIINGMEIEFGVEIDLENETGKCSISGNDKDSVLACYKKIQGIIKDFKAGEEATGEIFRVENYGAFIRFDEGGKESMIHISNLGNGKRIEKVEDVVKLGDKILVKIDSINNKGQLELVYLKHT